MTPILTPEQLNDIEKTNRCPVTAYTKYGELCQIGSPLNKDVEILIQSHRELEKLLDEAEKALKDVQSGMGDSGGNPEHWEGIDAHDLRESLADKVRVSREALAAIRSARAKET